MTDREFQMNELTRFAVQNSAYFDSISEFDKSLLDMDILEQIDWIENGSYGAGACFALQRALKNSGARTNKQARIGAVVLHAFYGKPFVGWKKLSKAAQAKMNKAVNDWLSQAHEFAALLVD